VAPADDYKDRVTGRTVAKVTTGQIYWGAVPFVLIQILMVGLIITFPNLVSGGLSAKKAVDTSNVVIEVQPTDQPKDDKVDMDALFGQPGASAPATPSGPAASAAAPTKADGPAEIDPIKAMEEAARTKP